MWKRQAQSLLDIVCSTRAIYTGCMSSRLLETEYVRKLRLRSATHLFFSHSDKILFLIYLNQHEPVGKLETCSSVGPEVALLLTLQFLSLGRKGPRRTSSTRGMGDISTREWWLLSLKSVLLNFSPTSEVKTVTFESALFNCHLQDPLT